MAHEKIADANVFVDKTGVKDGDLGNKIKMTIKKNQQAVKDFLMSDAEQLQFKFEAKRVTRKRSGNVQIKNSN